METSLQFYQEILKRLNLDKHYFEIKNILQKYPLNLEDDFWNYRLRYSDEMIYNLNYGMKAWYAGFFLESFRNTYKAYLQAIELGDEDKKKLTLSNITFCDGKWNNEQIVFLKKEVFFEPYHQYLNKNDIYVFSSHQKNLLREFIWKVCYHASIVYPRWKIIFMLIEGEEINLYFDEGEKYYKYIPTDEAIEVENVKKYLSLERKEGEKDKKTLIALCNYIICNSSYYL